MLPKGLVNVPLSSFSPAGGTPRNDGAIDGTIYHSASVDTRDHDRDHVRFNHDDGHDPNDDHNDTSDQSSEAALQQRRAKINRRRSAPLIVNYKTGLRKVEDGTKDLDEPIVAGSTSALKEGGDEGGNEGDRGRTLNSNRLLSPAGNRSPLLAQYVSRIDGSSGSSSSNSSGDGGGRGGGDGGSSSSSSSGGGGGDGGSSSSSSSSVGGGDGGGSSSSSSVGGGDDGGGSSSSSSSSVDGGGRGGGGSSSSSSSGDGDLGGGSGSGGGDDVATKPILPDGSPGRCRSPSTGVRPNLVAMQDSNSFRHSHYHGKRDKQDIDDGNGSATGGNDKDKSGSGSGSGSGSVNRKSPSASFRRHKSLERINEGKDTSDLESQSNSKGSNSNSIRIKGDHQNVTAVLSSQESTNSTNSFRRGAVQVLSPVPSASSGAPPDATTASATSPTPATAAATAAPKGVECVYAPGDLTGNLSTLRQFTTVRKFHTATMQLGVRNPQRRGKHGERILNPLRPIHVYYPHINPQHKPIIV